MGNCHEYRGIPKAEVLGTPLFLQSFYNSLMNFLPFYYDNEELFKLTGQEEQDVEKNK
jgi:hypothetical protein